MVCGNCCVAVSVMPVLISVVCASVRCFGVGACVYDVVSKKCVWKLKSPKSTCGVCGVIREVMVCRSAVCSGAVCGKCVSMRVMGEPFTEKVACRMCGVSVCVAMRCVVCGVYRNASVFCVLYRAWCLMRSVCVCSVGCASVIQCMCVLGKSVFMCVYFV